MKRALTVLAIASITLAACSGDGAATEDELIDQRAAEVMPFDLDKTSHTFLKTDIGGEQTVVALDPNDANQVALVRDHLAGEADRFRRGDYADPAEIHGMEMPGLHELSTRYAEIDVVYAEIDGGAQITYTASDASLIDAIHAWFDRQTTDHS